MAKKPSKEVLETNDEEDLDEEEDELPSPKGLAAAIVDTPVRKMKITMGEVSKILGVTRSTVRRYVDRQMLIPCETNPSGVKYFWTTDVEAFRNMGLLDDSPEEEQQNIAAQAMLGLVKEGLIHARQSAQLYFGPSQIAHQSLERIVERQAERIRELETREAETMKLLHELQDRRHEREMEMAELRAKAENRRYALQEGLKTLPWITSAIAEKFGMSPISSAVTKFLSVLDPAKLKLLAAPDIGILSDTERAALIEMLNAAGISLEETNHEESAEPAETK